MRCSGSRSLSFREKLSAPRVAAVSRGNELHAKVRGENFIYLFSVFLWVLVDVCVCALHVSMYLLPFSFSLLKLFSTLVRIGLSEKTCFNLKIKLFRSYFQI